MLTKLVDALNHIQVFRVQKSEVQKSFECICWKRKVDDLASTWDLTTSLKHNTGLDILHNLMFICWFKNILLHIFIFYSQVAWSIKTSWLELLVAWFRWSSYCLVATLLRYVKICRHNVNGQEYNPDFDMSSCSFPFPKFILHKFLTMLAHMLIIVIFTRTIIKTLDEDQNHEISMMKIIPDINN